MVASGSMMGITDTTIQKPSLLTVLGKIAALLTHSPLSDGHLDEPLAILGAAVGAHAAGIYRKWYLRAFRVKSLSLTCA